MGRSVPIEALPLYSGEVLPRARVPGPGGGIPKGGEAALLCSLQPLAAGRARELPRPPCRPILRLAAFCRRRALMDVTRFSEASSESMSVAPTRCYGRFCGVSAHELCSGG